MQFQHLNKNLARDPDYLDRLLTENEAASFLGFTIRALQGWRVKGGGPKFVKIGKKAVRYRRRDLIAWTEDNVRANTCEGI